MATYKNRHYGNFTQIDNAVIRSGISPAALGALVMLLSHGENWHLNIEHFQKEMGIGERATRTIIHELIKAGHIEEIKDRDQKGRFKPTTYNIYETPKTKQEKQPEKTSPVKKVPNESPNVDNPHGENQHVDNDGAIPYYNNKEAIKKEAVKTEAEKAEPARLPHGKHQNVFLTDDEYNSLVEIYGKEQTDHSIDTFSDYKKKTHNWKGKNDFRKLMDTWINKDIEWGKVPKFHSHYQTAPPQNPEVSEQQKRLDELMKAVLSGDFDALKGVSL
ncbi:MAG: helix-turn-helix domain-containing protein [Alistipes senegalensis]|nr:helix-turn-helix domain-containing protein [Alistipes senegalensis]